MSSLSVCILGNNSADCALIWVEREHETCLCAWMQGRIRCLFMRGLRHKYPLVFTIKHINNKDELSVFAARLIVGGFHRFPAPHSQGSVHSDRLAGWRSEVSSPSAGEGLDSQELESGDSQ